MSYITHKTRQSRLPKRFREVSSMHLGGKKLFIPLSFTPSFRAPFALGNKVSFNFKSTAPRKWTIFHCIKIKAIEISMDIMSGTPETKRAKDFIISLICLSVEKKCTWYKSRPVGGSKRSTAIFNVEWVCVGRHNSDLI